MDIKKFIKDLIEKAKILVHETVNKLFEWLEKKVDKYFETHPHS